MSLTGTWNLSISTPVGAQSAVLELTEDDGVVAGVLKNDADTLALNNPLLQGARLTWHSALTRPLRLNLAFDVTFDGDTLTGTSKAGFLPASSVTGRRVAEKRKDDR
ncbi:MAG TPA: hypothetical protein VKQ72_12980 [Aggregatilineales bacterium]|nr:hypothetical protein [Aggregatilineales bacterium]